MPETKPRGTVSSLEKMVDEKKTNKNNTLKIPTTPDEIRAQKDRLAKARQRQAAYNRKRREQKKLRVLYNRLHTLAKLSFFIIATLIIHQFFLMPFWWYTDTEFSLNNRTMLRGDRVAKVLNSYRGQPLYLISPQEIRAKLTERFPILEDITIRRYLFPARLELFVTEKQPWAELYYALDTKNPDDPPKQASRPKAIITDTHHIVSLKDYVYNPNQYSDLTISKLIVSPKIDLSEDYLAKLEALAYKLNHVPSMTFVALDVRNPNRVVAHFKETDVIVGKLDVALFRRLERLPKLVNKIREMKDTIQAVDLSWSEQITFQKRSGGSNLAKLTPQKQ